MKNILHTYLLLPSNLLTFSVSIFFFPVKKGERRRVGGCEKFFGQKKRCVKKSVCKFSRGLSRTRSASGGIYNFLMWVKVLQPFWIFAEKRLSLVIICVRKRCEGLVKLSCILLILHCKAFISDYAGCSS